MMSPGPLTLRWNRWSEPAPGNMDVELPDLSRCDKALLDILLPEASVIIVKFRGARRGVWEPDTRHHRDGLHLTGSRYSGSEQVSPSIARRFERVFDTVDLLLSPTVAFVAPAEDPAVAEDEGEIEMRFVAPWNLTGQPVLSMPCGFGETACLSAFN